jgi:hypothetical protein
VLEDAPLSLRARVPQLPAGLEHAIMRCLIKDRNRRFASVAHLAHALAPFGTEGARASLVRILHFLRATEDEHFAHRPAALPVARAPDSESRLIPFDAPANAARRRWAWVPVVLLIGGGLLYVATRAEGGLEPVPALDTAPPASSVSAAGSSAPGLDPARGTESGLRRAAESVRKTLEPAPPPRPAAAPRNRARRTAHEQREALAKEPPARERTAPRALRAADVPADSRVDPESAPHARKLDAWDDASFGARH